MKLRSFFVLLSFFIFGATEFAVADDLNSYIEEANPSIENSVAVAPVNDWKIEPGKRAGLLLLGINSRAVLSLMGKPTELSQRSAGIEEIMWRAPQGTETRVILGADSVIQINVSAPQYRDPLGNGVSSPLSTIFARYRAKGYILPRQFIFNVEDPAGGGYEANIYDDVEAGIAYHLGVQDDFNLSSPPDSVIVHRAGKAALPAKGATPISKAQKTQQEKVQNAPMLIPRVATIPHALGNGLPLTEVVTDEGVRGWRTNSVVLPGRVFIQAYAVTGVPAGQNLWHPLVSMSIIASQDRPVWQDVRQVIFSWGYHRLALSASKETVPDNSTEVALTSTILRVRFPYRDFLDLSRAGKWTLTIGEASFPIEKPQTVGIRALARICGASDISLETGSQSLLKAPTPVSNRAPISGVNEFFPQTRRRYLGRGEIHALSASDLRLAINEIYARHGLRFKDRELQRRFESLGWYRPREERTAAIIEGQLSRIEHTNLDLLVEERKNRS